MDNNENRETIEIDIKQLLMALWSRRWVILLTGVLFAAMLFGYAWLFVAPTYSASAQLYVNNNYSDSSSVSSSQIVAAQNLADTYMVILESRSVLTEVIKQTGLPYTYREIKEMVSAAAVNGTEIFEVEVVCTNSQHAVQIANTLVDILPGRIAKVIEGSSVGVVDYAVENQTPIGPSYQRYAIIGALLGILISAAVVVVADLLDTSINSEDYLTQVYGDVPLLAVIPGAQNPKTGYYRGYYESEQKRQPTKKSGGAKK